MEFLEQNKDKGDLMKPTRRTTTFQEETMESSFLPPQILFKKGWAQKRRSSSLTIFYSQELTSLTRSPYPSISYPQTTCRGGCSRFQIFSILYNSECETCGYITTYIFVSTKFKISINFVSSSDFQPVPTFRLHPYTISMTHF